MTSKASDAAIERVAERWNDALPTTPLTWRAEFYGRHGAEVFANECDREQTLSDALRTVHGDNIPDALAGFVLPVVVDPIVQMVRDAFAQAYREANFPNCTKRALEGWDDDSPQFIAALSVARAIAAQGGGA